MTVSSRTGATIKPVLRLIKVWSSIGTFDEDICGITHSISDGEFPWGLLARPAKGSCIAAFDPADEPADMKAAAERQFEFATATLSDLFVFRPLRHEALQPRQIDHAARQRRCVQSVKLQGD